MVQRLNFSTLSVLHTLSRGGPMRLTDLLATEQIKQPALTSLVSKLEAAGLVSRRPDPGDGRAALLSLTPAGETVVRSRHADRVAKLAQLTDRLDDRDRAVLADAQHVLSRLVAIARDPSAEPSEWLAGLTAAQEDDVTRFPLEPTPIHVPAEVLDDLRARLALTRPPLDEGNEDWFYGVLHSYLPELVAYWRDGFDWRKPGRGPRPVPLILTHGVPARLRFPWAADRLS